MNTTKKQIAAANAPKVWVLVSTVNDYNQHGEYFEAAFNSKPSIEQLAAFFDDVAGMPSNVMAALAFLISLAAGGAVAPTQDEQATSYTLKEYTLL